MKNQRGSMVLIMTLVVVLVVILFGMIKFMGPKQLAQTAIPSSPATTVSPSPTSAVDEINSLDDGSSSDSDVNSVDSDLQNL